MSEQKNPFPSLSMIKRVAVQNPGAIYKVIKELVERVEELENELDVLEAYLSKAEITLSEIANVRAYKEALLEVKKKAQQYFRGDAE